MYILFLLICFGLIDTKWRSALNYKSTHVVFIIQINFQHPASSSEIKSLWEYSHAFVLLKCGLDLWIIEFNRRLILRFFIKDCICIGNLFDDICTWLPRSNVNFFTIIDNKFGTPRAWIIECGISFCFLVLSWLIISRLICYRT